MNIFVNPGNQHADKYLFGGRKSGVFALFKNTIHSVDENIAFIYRMLTPSQRKDTPSILQNVFSGI